MLTGNKKQQETYAFHYKNCVQSVRSLKVNIVEDQLVGAKCGKNVFSPPQ